MCKVAIVHNCPVALSRWCPVLTLHVRYACVHVQYACVHAYPARMRAYLQSAVHRCLAIRARTSCQSICIFRSQPEAGCLGVALWCLQAAAGAYVTTGRVLNNVNVNLNVARHDSHGRGIPETAQA